MELNKLLEELTNLTKRLNGYVDEEGKKHSGILDWIRKHPETDPNAYEIMDCNVRFAEILSQLRMYYVKEGDIPEDYDLGEFMASVSFMNELHPEIEEAYKAIGNMDDLRKTIEHPFFTSDAANAMYYAIKCSQDNADYIVPEDESLKIIKRELLCKSMSVPFYIWQTQRMEPNYQYDNIVEFEGMKTAYSLYAEFEKPMQFGRQIAALHDTIEKNYQYSTQPQINTVK